MAPPSKSTWFTIDLVEKVFEGPFTLSELKSNLVNQKIYWSDIAICPSENLAWVRLFEIPELTELCPPLPSPEMLKHYRNVSFKQNTKIRETLKIPPGGPMASSVNLPKSMPKPVIEKSRVKTMVRERDLEKTKTNLKHQVRVSAPGSAPSGPKAPKPPSGPAEWHLLIDDNEGGPFTLSEIETAFKNGKRASRAYVWREGMSRWKPIERVKQFRHLNPNAYGADFADDEDDDQFKIEMGRNARQANRKHFVASVTRISSSGIAQMIGVTGDMSVSGMRLHQDSLRVNYPVDSKHILEIKPLKKSKLGPFRVTAYVRWVDPVSYEIGFEFIDMKSYDRVLLQKYFDSLNKKIS